MDGASQPSVTSGSADGVLASAAVPCDVPDAVKRLKTKLGTRPFSLVVLFASPGTDLDRLTAEAAQTWTPAQVVGCTTAGEICGDFGGSVCRDDTYDRVDTECFELIDTALHRGKVAVGAHDDCYL